MDTPFADSVAVARKLEDLGYVVGAIISTGFLVAAVKHQPFLTEFDNRFKILTDFALVITFNISLMLQNPGGDDIGL